MLRLMAMRAPAVVLLAVLAACGGSGTYLGSWTGPDGQAAERGEGRDRRYEIRSIAGPDHCDWGSVVFLQVGWPLGTTQGIGLPDASREYVRDADGQLPDRVQQGLAGELDTDADLPAQSNETGYRTGDVQLWFGPDDGDRYAYLVDGERVERWPRAEEPIACA